MQKGSRIRPETESGHKEGNVCYRLPATLLISVKVGAYPFGLNINGTPDNEMDKKAAI